MTTTTVTRTITTTHLSDLLEAGLATRFEVAGVYVVKRADGTSVAYRDHQVVFAPAVDDYEAHLEQADWAEQDAFADYEARSGVVSFEDAWIAADPVYAAGRTLRRAQQDAFEQAVYENGRTSVGLDTPEWIARMDTIVEEILAAQDTSTVAEEARVAAVAAELGR